MAGRTYECFRSCFGPSSSSMCTATEKRFQKAGSRTPDMVIAEALAGFSRTWEWCFHAGCADSAIEGAVRHRCGRSSTRSACLCEQIRSGRLLEGLGGLRNAGF